MTFFDLLDPEFTRAANTSGGEYAGACPFCGGNDRFRVWPETDRAWCRQCGWKGDSVQFVRDTKGLSYAEACQYLGVEPQQRAAGTKPVSSSTWQPKTPKPAPGDVWQQKCRAFLEWTQKQIHENTSALNWLQNERGLIMETIRAAGLGYNPRQFYRDRQEFGLQQEINTKTGKSKKVWLPAGLVIPCFDKGRIVRLRIRQDQIGPKDDRYILVPGGTTQPMILGNADAVVIVESELDAILINQVAGDLVSVIALGSAQIRPDTETDKRLRQAGLILNALDSDAAGAKEAWGFWRDNYGAKRWPCIKAKDPTEMQQTGVSVRQWIKAALPGSVEAAKPDTQPVAPQRTLCGGSRLKIQRMANCLHQKPCKQLVSDPPERPRCAVNGVPIFDLEQCPKGLWFNVSSER